MPFGEEVAGHNNDNMIDHDCGGSPCWYFDCESLSQESVASFIFVEPQIIPQCQTTVEKFKTL